MFGRILACLLVAGLLAPNADTQSAAIAWPGLWQETP